MDEATIREIVRDEIAKALRAAEVEGPHMKRFARRITIAVADSHDRAVKPMATMAQGSSRSRI
ncbi:hypothetical protein [uncultured Brevundimonas sp.]|uniref:hypothetical protein n=1 Tax=uncultured Brevundimonas sp. TaxID=213418 RepID=UPI0025E5CF55|nr:hypothetical protein [uncultured Brevundimonas sp.]